MSILTNRNPKTVQAQAIDGIASILAKEGSSISTPALAEMAASLESIDSQSHGEVTQVLSSVVADLEASPLGKIVLADHTPEQREIALEAAALTMMANGDLVSAHSYGTSKPQAIDGGVLVSPQQGGTDYSEEYTLESFDEVSLQKYVAQSAYANAMAAVGGGFEELFYPAVLVPVGQNGVDVTVSIPKVYPAVTRSKDGTVKKFEKKSIIKALIDSTILDAASTDIVTYASNATTPASLVAQAVIPDIIKVVDGNDINTRPILFGSKVDLISLSSAPALLASGTYTETDSLETVMNIGTVYYKLEIIADPAGIPVATEVILAVDVSTQNGSLFTQTATGSSKDFQLNLLADVVINKNLNAIVGDGAAMVTSLETALGLGAGEDFQIVNELSIAATANVEYADMVAHANSFVSVNIYGPTGAAISLTEIDDAAYKVNLTALGYIPNARRTNSNMATRGTIIDSTETTVYRFPVPMGSPFVSQNAVGASINTTIEGLGHAARIRTNGNAVKALVNMETILEANSGIPVNSPAMGAEMITPTLVKPAAAIDAAAIIGSAQTADTLGDLRGALVAIVVSTANEMIRKSGYLAALEISTGKRSGYEIIVVTDSHIASVLESGSDITLGNGVKVKISQTSNSKVDGKIYIAIRRTSRDGFHPLDFGGTLFQPALSYDAQVSRGNQTIKELHHVPKTVSYTTCPIMGVLTVVNLATAFNT